jgi:hypothetical protein
MRLILFFILLFLALRSDAQLDSNTHFKQKTSSSIKIRDSGAVLKGNIRRYSFKINVYSLAF